MIIKSILDTDLYKFTTSYAYMKLFPQAKGTFQFIDRDNTEYTEEFLQNLRMELINFSALKLTADEQEFMTENCRFIPPVYWEWLSSIKLSAGKVRTWLDEEKHLHIEATDYLYKVTLYEVPILAIVSELRNKMLGNTINMTDVINKLVPKVNLSNTERMRFSEFGTRRRYSYNVQETVIRYIKEKSIYCTGTSNCYLAMKYGMPMMGTHPHEWFMFHGAMYGYKQANYMALENWVNVYDGDLGIALSDTYTSEVFFKNLSKKQAKLFDGVRHDSGDPYKFVLQAIARYKELGIDPSTKTVIFSNALTFPDAVDLQKYCEGRIRSAAGIGTNLTNDTGYKPSNIVMKLISCQMNSKQPIFNCVKLSDDLGKHTGNVDEVERCKTNLNIAI